LASNVGGVLTFTHAGPLAAGQSLPDITVNVTYTATGDQTDTGHVNPATGETDTTDNDDSVTTTVTAPPPPPPAAPNLGIVKSGPSTGTLGSQGQYTLTVSNAAGAGDDTDTTITVTDALPSGEAFVSSSGTGWTLTSNVGGLLTFTHAGPLAAGVSLPPITVTVTYTAVGGHTDTGTVVAATNETDTTDNTSQVTTTVSPVVGPPAPPAPNLAIVKSGPAAGVVGGEGAYTLTVSNAAGAGDDTDSTITVTDTLPAGEAYLSSSGTGWTLVSNNGSLLTFSHAGPLAAGQSLPVLTVTVTYTATGAQTDTAVVLPATGETDTSDNESSATTTVSATTAAAPDLTVVKHALSDRVTGGDTLLYTLTVTNVGAGSTTGAVTVTDQVPAGLTGISAAGIGWQCHLVGRLVTCVWTGGQVAPGVTLPVITVTTTVLDTAVGTLVNTAVVHTPHDINTGNDTSTVTTPVIQVLGEKQTRTPAPRTPAPAVEPESLPFTGANSAGLASFGVLLLAAGAAALGLGRRRPKGRHAA
jgi:uncharacterized repeat protein (TIGR01451 family)